MKTETTIAQSVEEAVNITKGIIESNGGGTAAQRKKPGRPKKTAVISIGNDVRGVQDTAIDGDNVVEFTYDNPVLIKKIISLYKSYEAENIEFVFTPTEFKMIAKDHLQKSSIYVTIRCDVMNHYYCKDDLRITVRRENFDKILCSIEKDQHKMLMFIKAISKRNTLNIVLHNCRFDKDNTYNIPIELPTNAQNNRAADPIYPIHFTLDSKHFKSEIVKIGKMTDKVIFQKDGTKPLEITFSSDQKINYCGIYNDSSKISLQSTIVDDEIVHVMVNIEDIKPYSNVCLAELTNISLSNDSDICFTSNLDRRGEDIYAIIAKVFVEIKTS